ncbi:OmpH family outer membrane protein [Flavobacterium sp. 3HN19-14]|uniref:OmpH family outer membrane protein n=1 Tax=Flavobacterium sp. 3HN19-14 TaxID=3448133 RepID=UPI003EDFB90E
MKRIIVVIALALSIVSCNKTTETVKESKIAYIDTAELMKNSTEAKDLQEKYKTKSEEMGHKLDAEIERFKSDYANFEKNARANGQAWAEQYGPQIMQRKEQLQYAQQSIAQQLQQESAVEMDTMTNNMKKFIKAYGKEKGYSWIYGTGDAESVLYAEEKYNITKEITKLINDKYDGKKEEKTATPVKKEEKK